MPWIAPSHTAPVLALKMWKPRAFSGLALCIGSAAPDLEFILRIDYDWVVSHTFAGQVFFTIPLVMVLHALLTTLVIPWVIPLLPPGPPFHLHDLSLERPASSPLEWTRVAVSGFVGGLTHVFLDGFTHGNHSGWALPWLPFLATPLPLPGGPIPVYDFLQVLLTIVLGAWGLNLLAEIGRRRLLRVWCGRRPAAVPEATAEDRQGALGYGLFCAAVGIVAALARHSETHGPLLHILAHGVLAFLFYGAVLAGATLRLRVPAAARVTEATD